MTSSASSGVVIAGAGIGGLAAALALAKRGIASRVFERRLDGLDDGAGIQLGPNGAKVLAQLGLLDAVRKRAAEPDALSVHDGRSGRILTRLPLGTWMTTRYEAPYLTLHRLDLHEVFLGAARIEPLIELRTGEVSGFDVGASGVDVALADGEVSRADALICADGLWSRLRSRVCQSPLPTASGSCAFRAVVPAEALPSTLARNDVHVWLSPRAHVVHYPVRGGAAVAIVVIIDGNTHELGWNAAASTASVMSAVEGKFTGALLDFLRHVASWRMWPLQNLVPLERWTLGSAVLIGDAAHPVLPFFAQGAGLALEDASELAHHISRTDLDMPQRLTAFEAARRARTMRVAKASVENGKIYHMQGGMAAARNAVLARVPATALMRRYDWLYGWRPR